MTHKGPGLYDFLIEAELQQYFTSLKNDLKVSLADVHSLTNFFINRGGWCLKCRL